jgi:2-polyprenyl-3-methyl-5-hydroxy-6-metoxy-1,4-benzoquinol methylase
MGAGDDERARGAGSRPASHGAVCSLARRLANSPAFTRGRRLWDANQKAWDLPLTKLDKLQVGLYLILQDYATGRFPPTFPDQQLAYEAERAVRHVLPGITESEFELSDMRKPFWVGEGPAYLRDYIGLVQSLEALSILPPARLLELGCGSGWTAEFLATQGYAVLGTTISSEDVRVARRRIDALRAKALPVSLRFEMSPMEDVAGLAADDSGFDAVYVFEALHHAFDWKEAVAAARARLRDGGWLLLCNEPNVVHTCVSYRVARLTNTHEIGFLRGDLLRTLRAVGFRRSIILRNRWHGWYRPHWIAAQR